MAERRDAEPDGAGAGPVADGSAEVRDERGAPPDEQDAGPAGPRQWPFTAPGTISSPGDASADAQALAERVVAGMMARDAFSRWLGVRIVEVRPYRVVVRLTVRDEMLNGFGVCHGGVTFALADSALAFVSNTNGRVTVSIENSIGYPAAVQGGDVLTAIAEEERAGGRVAFYRVTVRNQREETVALFRGTVYRTQREHGASADRQVGGTGAGTPRPDGPGR